MIIANPRRLFAKNGCVEMLRTLIPNSPFPAHVPPFLSASAPHYATRNSELPDDYMMSL